eukprot:scaffold368226_cov55-Attheya_sp.AAC.1
MAPLTPTMTPNVTPIHSRLEDDDTHKQKAIATPPRPMPPHTGDSCLRHLGGSVGYILVLSYRVSWLVLFFLLDFSMPRYPSG